jgi:hypothetical protein
VTRSWGRRSCSVRSSAASSVLMRYFDGYSSRVQHDFVRSMSSRTPPQRAHACPAAAALKRGKSFPAATRTLVKRRQPYRSDDARHRFPRRHRRGVEGESAALAERVAEHAPDRFARTRPRAMPTALNASSLQPAGHRCSHGARCVAVMLRGPAELP